MEIVKLNTKFRRPRQIRGKEIWAQNEPPQEMVWEVCPYLRDHLDESRCQQCPTWFDDPTYGKMQRMCYGLAAEVCRIVFAAQKRLEKPKP